MVAASPRGGMGSVLHDGGCTFRVWGPNAEHVRVVGPSGPLIGGVDLSRDASDGSGAAYWSGFVQGVRADDEYRFELTARGNTWSRLDPYCRDATSSAGNSLVCDPSFDWRDGDYRSPDWNGVVIYEMHVGSFNVPPDTGTGTFDSLIQKLDYLADLGVSHLQLLPAFEFDNDRSIGYNPSLPFALESAYGTPNAFKRLVSEAHRRGIGVILDVVYNHWGPAGLGESLWQFDGWEQWKNGGIYFYNDDRKWTPWGDRPDYGRAEVRQYIRDNALTLLGDYHVDGVRWDSTGCCRMNRGLCDGECCGETLPDGWSVMKWVNDEIDREFPWKLSIAEDLHDEAAITRKTSSGGAGFDAQWGPSFLHPVRRAVIAEFDGQRDMYDVARAIGQNYDGDAFKRVIYVESHNEAHVRRLTEEIWTGDAANWFARKRSTLAAAVLFTSPGIPMFFQGAELLEWGAWNDGQGLDWNKATWFSGIHALYRDLVRLRRNWNDNTRGLRGQHVNVFHVNQNDKLIAYHRWSEGGPGDDVIVVANFADRSYDAYELGFPHWGGWAVRFNSDWKGYSADFGSHPGYDTWAGGDGKDGMPFRANVGIGPYSVLILSQ